MQQLTIFDFIPSGEAQIDDVPVFNQGLNSAPIGDSSGIEISRSTIAKRYRWDLGQIVHLKVKSEPLPICGSIGEYPEEGKHVDYGVRAVWGAMGEWLEEKYILDFPECPDCFPKPDPNPDQLTPVKWSLAGSETHLLAPGATTPICGAPDGPEGTYTATGQPYSWQTCVRGLTTMCAACARLEGR